MADLDNIIESDETKEESSAEKRIKELSNKVKLTAQERDDLAKAKQELEAKASSAEKKAGFYKDFAKLSAKYPGANEHMDDIEAKVMAGYDPEDATVSVLNKAGKFIQPKQESEQVAGGSAPTSNVQSAGQKSLGDMTRDEKRAALEQIESETGALSRILEKKTVN